jgi:hypothetical protein
MQELKLA